MSCRATARALLENELGLLRPAERDSLRHHLHDCPSCRRLAEAESALSRELTALGAAPVPDIQVRSRVMAGLRAAGEVDRSVVSGRQLAWSSMSAILAAVVWRLTAI